MAILSSLLARARRHPIASLAAVFLLAFVLLLMFARYWITTDAGRDFVVSQLDGRDIAGYGHLSVRRLEGDPLSDFSVGSIEVRDASGVWLTAETVELSWSPMELLSRNVDLESLNIAGVEIQRLPVRAERPASSSKPWAVRVEDAQIRRLFLAAGVAGPESAFAVTARFLNEKNGSLDAELRISPLEGAGDRIDARILRKRNASFDVNVDGIAPAGGVFAHLLRLPEGASALVAATAAGDLKDGRGEARLMIDGADKVFLSGKIEDNSLEAVMQLDAGALPVSASLAEFLGPATKADLSAQFGRKIVTFKLAGQIAAGTFSLSGQSRSGKFDLVEPASLKANLTSLSPFWEDAEALNLDGTVEKREAGYIYTGETLLQISEDSSLPFERVSGPVTASLENGRIPFTGNVTIIKPFASNSSLSEILGDDVHATGNGHYDLKTRRVILNAVELTHRSGNAQLLGEAGFSEGDLNVSGKLTQNLNALPGGFGGEASGFVQAKGQLRDVELGLTLNLSGLTANLGSLDPLVEGRGTVRGMLRIKPEGGTIDRLDVRLPGLEGRIYGRAYGERSPDLRINAKQLQPVAVGENVFDLNMITAQVRGVSAGTRIIVNSEQGEATIGARRIADLSADADLSMQNGDISGPVTLTGTSDGQPSAISFMLDRSENTTRFNTIEGRIGTIEIAGSAKLTDGGDLEAALDAAASSFEFGGISFAALKLKGNAGRMADRPFSLGGEFEASGVQLTSQLAVDEIKGTMTTTKEGYRFDGRLLDKQAGANTDVTFSGLVRTSAEGPTSGSLSLSGLLLGTPVSTRKDIAWTLGTTPTADMDLSLLGGRVQARLRPGNETSSSSVTLDNLSVEPLLAAFGLPGLDAVLSGQANGRLFGTNPEGTVRLAARSSLSGLNTALDFTANGTLTRQTLALTAQATYGPKLKANAAAKLPVTASAGLVAIDRSARVEGLADIHGDLAALRLIALAYGHDVGGTLSSRLTLSGSLKDPKLSANGKVTGGNYEYGATGLSLKNVNLDARFVDRVLTLNGGGNGSQGGTLKLDGRLAEAEAGLSVKFDKFVVYDRVGDLARISGDAKLVEGADDRVLSGSLDINDARFNIENLSSNSIRTLNVRWTSDDPDAARDNLLQKPIRLNLKVSAPRGVFVKGRGLDSDWGVTLDVTGTPNDIRLNGRATLVRGSLELAQRPFEFETGQITFDGPIESARLAISATREVDGFSVRADVGGAPARPTIELSSSPSLPEDEILSRMLFGRSSVDLSALEAAELATSIARLAGRDPGLNPVGLIQDELGVDRLRLGVDGAGNPELGVGQYLAPDVYLEVTTQGAAGNSVEVEWQPRPQVSVASETSSTGESRISVRWKKDY